MTILLSTLNARFAHASLGLRYLKANMGVLYPDTILKEFTIQQNTQDILEAIIACEPKIVGFGVYIWNITETTRLVQVLKTLRPDIVVILGGPEVSYEYTHTEIVQWADYLITGWGEISFPLLCQAILTGEPPAQKVITGVQAELEKLQLPYDEYTDEDLQHRTIYVEASRGCPFKCEFCLSSLDKTAWSFPLTPFLVAMQNLYARGLRQFKFVDRTFNLKQEFTTTILTFFLDQLRADSQAFIFLHFELVPDHLPESLKALIVQFPEGSLQFEIGIQTLYPTTQQLISRRTNLVKAKENIQWLVHHTAVHLHVDLIAGLPGEDLQTFGKGFNTLYSWQPHEIQLGILKRLKGTPIIRHTQTYAFKYSPEPPYAVLENNLITFTEMNTLKRLAKYWDLIANSGRFSHTLILLLDVNPFENMCEFSQWLYQKTGKTYAIALDRLFVLVFEYLVTVKQLNQQQVQNSMADDFMKTGIQGWPKVLGTPPVEWKAHLKAKQPVNKPLNEAIVAQVMPKRQQRHV